MRRSLGDSAESDGRACTATARSVVYIIPCAHWYLPQRPDLRLVKCSIVADVKKEKATTDLVGMHKKMSTVGCTYRMHEELWDGRVRRDLLQLRVEAAGGRERATMQREPLCAVLLRDDLILASIRWRNRTQRAHGWT